MIARNHIDTSAERWRLAKKMPYRPERFTGEDDPECAHPDCQGSVSDPGEEFCSDCRDCRREEE